ncbi:DUF2911 domain-containing protein [Olivibacter sitiensis]|uniref:DUF2911 domain-containing protein n=1 Tax=Olivibacter sitiensis TaxID=376470 RepID=UPI0005601DD4|nr:DUF2911 domain-containing protein [Olivibacter sitiensis]
MKKYLLLFCLCTVGSMVFAQGQRQRQSPHDTIATTLADKAELTITYGRPYIKGRQLGVEIAPVGIVWRVGADEATTFTFSKDVLVNDKPLPAGVYSLHAIPGEYNTTIIFNKEWQKWGLKYDESQDALRVEAPVQSSDKFYEQFTIEVTNDGTVKLLWGDFSIPFKIKTQ